jgi:hypothetical protein
VFVTEKREMEREADGQSLRWREERYRDRKKQD